MEKLSKSETCPRRRGATARSGKGFGSMRRRLVLYATYTRSSYNIRCSGRVEGSPRCRSNREGRSRESSGSNRFLLTVHPSAVRERDTNLGKDSEFAYTTAVRHRYEHGPFHPHRMHLCQVPCTPFGADLRFSGVSLAGERKLARVSSDVCRNDIYD